MQHGVSTWVGRGVCFQCKECVCTLSIRKDKAWALHVQSKIRNELENITTTTIKQTHRERDTLVVTSGKRVHVGAEKDLPPPPPAPHNLFLLMTPPQSLNPKSATQNPQSSDYPKIGRLAFNSFGDHGCSKGQWGYLGTLSSSMYILTSFMQSDLCVQLRRQRHTQPGRVRQYTRMILGLYLPTYLLNCEIYLAPDFRKEVSSLCDLPGGPSRDWQPSLHLWRHLSLPLPFPPLYTGPVPQPVTQGHFASSTSAQDLNLRKTPFFQCPGLFMEPPKNNDSVPKPEELQSLKSTVEHQLAIGIRNWTVVLRAPEIGA